MTRKCVNLAVVRNGKSTLARLVTEYPELTSADAQTRLAEHLRTDLSNVLTIGTEAGTVLYMSAPVPERRAVNLRLDPDLMAVVNAAEAAIPALSRHAICLAALHIGLAALIDDPALALGQNIRGRKPPIKRKKGAK